MMGDSVRSKPWLGLLGNVSAVMATGAAFGLAMYLQVEFIGINLAAPFLMIGKKFTCFESEKNANCCSAIIKCCRFSHLLCDDYVHGLALMC